jgi:hypothetical protein
MHQYTNFATARYELRQGRHQSELPEIFFDAFFDRREIQIAENPYHFDAEFGRF